MRIICVDDNETMLDLTADILRLERSDCEIQTFVSGKQALAFIKENGCDILLTDFSMPGMHGGELITQVKAIDSGIYCILVTGSSPYVLREHYPGDVFDGLLKKPYSYKELLSLIDVGVKVRAERLAKEIVKPVVSEATVAAPAMTRQTAVRQVRAFLGKIWDEADLAASPLEFEYGCLNPAYFAVRVKEEIGRARRYCRPLSIIKIDLTNLAQAGAQSGSPQDRDLAKTVLRIITPNVRASDLVSYQHPWVFVLLPEASEAGKNSVVSRLGNSLRSRGILVAKGPEASGGVVFSSQTYSFEANNMNRLPADLTPGRR